MSRSTMFRANQIVGDHVRTAAGESLGKVEDLIFDPATGSVEYAVISFGGAFSGDRLHMIPLSMLRPSLEGDFLVFDGDRRFIERAPSFDRSHWPNLADPTWHKGVRDYYTGSTRPVQERVVVREVRDRPGSLLGAALAIVALICLLGFTYMVATRGWDQARDTVVNGVQGVAYAAKETSEDATLSAKVKTALSLSRRVPAGAINVDTQNEVVTLRGEVPNEETRTLAEMIARDTSGVTELHNEIRVNPAAVAAEEMQRMESRVADLEMKYLVHDRIVKNPELAGSNINVEVNGATATLTGTVATADQKYLAEQAASSIEGVRSVNNQVRVSGY
jgi:osmotically-inducible protein OsmY